MLSQKRVLTPRPALLQDYLFQYRAGIEAVTPADVLAAARRQARNPLCSCYSDSLFWVPSPIAISVLHRSIGRRSLLHPSTLG